MTNKTKRKQCICISTNKRKTELWDDGTIVIHTKVSTSGKIESNILTNFIELDLQKTKKLICCKLQINNKTDLGINKSFQFFIKKTNFLKRGKSEEKIRISGKAINQARGKQISITIPSGECTLTGFFQTIISFTSVGYELQKLLPIIQPLKKRISLEFKHEVLINFLHYLKRKKTLQPILEFKDPFEKNIKIFDDSVVVAEFSSGIPGKTQFKIPSILASAILPNQKIIVIIRNNQVVICKVTQVKNSFLCSSSVNITDGKKIKLLWVGIQKSKLVQNFISSIKTKKDYRTYLGLSFYNNLIIQKEEKNNLHQKTLRNLSKLYSLDYFLPIVRFNFRNSFHANEALTLFISKNFENQSRIGSLNQYQLFIQEALLSNIGGSFYKTVDWYLANLTDTSTFEKYVIEIKTCNSNEKTRTLQRAIAEYTQLIKNIPDVGTPVIVVSWILDKKKWVSYATRFGVLLLDPEDIFEIAIKGNLFEKLRTLKQTLLNNQHIDQPQSETNQINAQTILAQWLQSKKATKTEIKIYTSNIAILIQNLLHLFRHYKITSTNPLASYHRKGELQITDSLALNELHIKLTKGTQVIVEEELQFITERIRQIKNKELIPTGYKRPFERRRQTYDINRLEHLQKDLETLLFFKDHWGKPFRPIGVRMLISSTNQGSDFEQFVYHQLVNANYMVIRHVVVMIGNHNRELDMIAFTSSNREEKIIVSCSDSSQCNPQKFHHAKKSIMERLHNLQNIRNEIAFTKGLLYVKVATREQELKVNKWITYDDVLQDNLKKIEVIIVVSKID
ncbi:MAG: hypothetical protein ACTSO7_15500 [Candidatus Heimdallarchaeota archaeon]